MSRPWTWRVLPEAQIEQNREKSLTHIVECHGLAVQHLALLARARARGARGDETQGRFRHFTELYRRIGSDCGKLDSALRERSN